TSRLANPLWNRANPDERSDEGSRRLTNERGIDCGRTDPISDGNREYSPGTRMEPMSHLVLQYCVECIEGACALCKGVAILKPGLQLYHAESTGPVCAKCGRRAAPELTALQNLARTAEHVGRINNHMITPPLTVLLELARAAEQFSSKLPGLPSAV